MKKIATNTIIDLGKMSVFALAALFSIVTANAVGFRLPNQDPEAIARGNAFVATADDPSAIFYNPAGITQLNGQQASAGAYVISANSHFSSSTGGNAHTDATPQLVPQLYYVNSFTNVPLSVGLGIYAPYGLSLDWGNNAPFATGGYEGSLLYASVNPVIAWKVTKTFSIAAGATLNFSQATLHSALFPPPAFLGTQSKFTGDGWDPGYNLGALWQPASMWSFGVNYHSKTEIKYHGTFSENFGGGASTSSSATIPFPEYIVGGISFRPTPNWNFEFDLDWTKWNNVQSVTFNNTPFGPQTLIFNYQNSFIYEFGATRQLGNGYWASVGYMYSENSSPSQSFVPLIPDMNLNLGGIGFGHHGQRLDWAAAYQFAYGTRTVSNDANPSADGNYRTFNNAVNLSATIKF